MRADVLAYVSRHIAPILDRHGRPRFTRMCMCDGRLWYASNNYILIEGDCGIDEDNSGIYHVVQIREAAALEKDVDLASLGLGMSPSMFQERLARKARKPRRSWHDVTTLIDRCEGRDERMSLDDLLKRPAPHELDCGTYVNPTLVRSLLTACPESRLSVQRTLPTASIAFVGVGWRALLMPRGRPESA